LEDSHKTPSGPPGWLFLVVGLAAFGLLAAVYGRIWAVDGGLTRFIEIGSEFNRRGIAAYRDAPKFVDRYPVARWGFDGQHYAQIALDPLLRDPGLKTAIDNPPYRARRILLPWLAWLGGLGKPAWVLNVYAALNLIFWIPYAAMLAVLFRPAGWRGLAGFSAMLLTCGVIESMRAALTDFPAFVLMTGSAMAAGTAGAGLLALAGLTREVDVMGIVGILDFDLRKREAWTRDVILGLVAFLPMAAWFAYLTFRLGIASSVSGDNMDWPLRAIAGKLSETLRVARAGGLDWTAFYKNTEDHALLTIVATLTQCVYLLTHPDWRSRIWRVGAVFVPFFLCIGSPAWVAHFTVTRHALPITLAFNVALALRPRRSWIVWFLLGNGFVPYGLHLFWRIAYEQAQTTEIRVVGHPRTGAIEAGFAGGWTGAEHSDTKTWRWATAKDARLILHSGAPVPRASRISLFALSYRPVDLRIETGGRTVWTGRVTGDEHEIQTAEFDLPPGDSEIDFESLEPPAPSSSDPRELEFMVEDLTVHADSGPTGP
jgi:hypothetical protein